MTAGMFTGIRAVSVPVADQDRALGFYTTVLGLDLVRDVPTPAGGRWIELAAGGATVLTLEPAPADAPRSPVIPVRFSTADVNAAHRALLSAGVDTDDILQWPGVPAMFAFRDPDGNSFSVTGTD